MNSILYEKEITLNAIDSAYEKGKKDGLDSIIEELEKIKAEIHKLAFDDNDGEYISVIDNDDVMDLIDKRISELKEQ